MKLIRLAAVAALALSIAGCEQRPSRLDKVTTKERVADRAERTDRTDPAGGAPAPLKIDRSGNVEEQLKRLQDAYDRNAEAIDFLNKVFAQQKAQQQAQQREEAAPDAVFAVDIAPNVRAGMVEGPSTALVTIVEAWDFA